MNGTMAKIDAFFAILDSGRKSGTQQGPPGESTLPKAPSAGLWVTRPLDLKTPRRASTNQLASCAAWPLIEVVIEYRRPN